MHFSPEETLNARHAALLAGLRALLSENAETFHLAAACGGDAAPKKVRALLAAREHLWLCEPYVPGNDPFEAASGRREEELAQTG
jgi:hypothetical protein